MPFIKSERRKIIDKENNLYALCRASIADPYIQPGDRCYFYYRKMVDKWKVNPRWTTAHEIYKDMIPFSEGCPPDDKVAYQLAWQVFFIRHVVPYEKEAEERNGAIL